NDVVRILQKATNLSCTAAAERVFRKYSVLLKPEGSLQARFDIVSSFATEYELVSKLAECLAGSAVRVRKQPDGSLLYVSESKDKYTIDVIHDEVDTNHFQGVYYITAEWRFFTMEALLHLESRPGREGGIKYGVRIYANSDSRILSILARFSFVDRYLLREVNDVVAKFDTVYGQMLQDPLENQKKLLEYRDPKATIYFTDPEIDLIKDFVDQLLKSQSTNAPPASGVLEGTTSGR
ncbi:MAG: hypothetical protein C0404_08955, partial [Verrucomicrobia bacterium]|nr:hypothetical protein [Verrucomicrobiota bacterium]